MTGNATPTALAEARGRGVAVNPTATPDVLLRLLSGAAKSARRLLCEHRDLPDELIAAILAHPDRAVRAAMARNRFVDPAVRSMLANDSVDLVRAALASGPRGMRGRRTPLTNAALEALLLGEHPVEDRMVTDDEIRSELEGSWQIPHEFRRRALRHQDPRLRAWSTGMWLWLSPPERDRLLADPETEVRVAAAHADRLLNPDVTAAELPENDCHARAMLLMNYAVSPAVADRCLAERRNLWALAHNPFTPAATVAQLACDADPEVRERVASRIEISADLLAALAQDPVSTVRIRAHIHQLPRTEAERTAIDRVTGHSADVIGQVRDMYRNPAAEWYERCATSEHPLLRRVAATYTGLSPSTVQRLAADADADVRHLLAFNHPDAPPQLLIDAFLACRRQRQLLLTMPGLPRTGLEFLADDADPEVRALAAGDAALPASVHERLLTDDDIRVRRAAAANPVTSPERLEALLEDPELAEAAAANPNLTTARLHALLDCAGIPPKHVGHRPHRQSQPGKFPATRSRRKTDP